MNELKVKLVLDAGDYISPFTVSSFEGLKSKMIGVFGNNCAEKFLLRKLFSKIGFEVEGEFADIRMFNLKIALLHGHEEKLLNSLIDSQFYDVIIYGHTHKILVESVKKTLLINPGELCGYLSGRSTMAILNVKNLEVNFFEIQS